jgi:hypothetical protein
VEGIEEIVGGSLRASLHLREQETPDDPVGYLANRIEKPLINRALT